MGVPASCIDIVQSALTRFESLRAFRHYRLAIQIPHYIHLLLRGPRNNPQRMRSKQQHRLGLGLLTAVLTLDPITFITYLQPKPSPSMAAKVNCAVAPQGNIADVEKPCGNVVSAAPPRSLP